MTMENLNLGPDGKKKRWNRHTLGRTNPNARILQLKQEAWNQEQNQANSVVKIPAESLPTESSTRDLPLDSADRTQEILEQQNN